MRMSEITKGILATIAAVTIMVLIMLLFSACKSAKVAEIHRDTIYVAHNRVDTLRLTTIKVDSIKERDSVFLWMRGDTIYKEVYQWREKIKASTDTVYKVREKHDTIYVSKEKETEPIAKRNPNYWAIGALFLIIAMISLWAWWKEWKDKYKPL